jgi:16S rRNA processing protein RimM
VVGVHGISAEMAVRTTGDSPEGICRYHSLTWTPVRGGERQVTIASCRVHKGVALVHFNEVTTRDEAEEFVGGTLSVPREDLLPAAEGRHYIVDLIGLPVVSTKGEPIGTVKEVFETGANDVFIVDAGGREVLVPAVDHIVKEIDVPGRRIVIEVLEGLLE